MKILAAIGVVALVLFGLVVWRRGARERARQERMMRTVTGAPATDTALIREEIPSS